MGVTLGWFAFECWHIWGDKAWIKKYNDFKYWYQMLNLQTSNTAKPITKRSDRSKRISISTNQRLVSVWQQIGLKLTDYVSHPILGSKAFHNICQTYKTGRSTIQFKICIRSPDAYIWWIKKSKNYREFVLYFCSLTQRNKTKQKRQHWVHRYSNV